MTASAAINKSRAMYPTDKITWNIQTNKYVWLSPVGGFRKIASHGQKRGNFSKSLRIIRPFWEISSWKHVTGPMLRAENAAIKPAKNSTDVLGKSRIRLELKRLGNRKMGNFSKNAGRLSPTISKRYKRDVSQHVRIWVFESFDSRLALFSQMMSALFPSVCAYIISHLIEIKLAHFTSFM